MKKIMKRGVSLCMAVALLLTAAALAPPASAAGEESLESAEVKVGDSPEYNGSAQEPDVYVTLGEERLSEGTDYEISYRDNTDAGTAKAIVTGKGKYQGSKTVEFVIQQRKVLKKELKLVECIKPYDGTVEAQPEITATVVVGDDVEVTYTKAEFDTPYAGPSKKVTVSGIGFAGPDGANYTLEDPSIELKAYVGEITQVEPKFTKSAELAAGHSLDLLSLIANGWGGTASFALSEGQDSLGCTLDGSTLTAGETLGDVQITVETGDYNVDGKGKAEYVAGSGYYFITITIVEKEDPPDPVITVPPEEDDPSDPPQEEEEAPSITQVPEISVTYGETKTFIVQGGEGSGETTFRVEEYGGYGKATIDQNGILTPTEVGTVLVYAEQAGDDQYTESRSDPVLVRILPAPLTIQVKNQTAYVGSAAPTLTAADYTVTGLVGEDKLAKEPTLAYVTAPDMTRPGAVAIQVSGAEIPNSNYDPNITYVPGVLTIQEVPSYTITVQPVKNGSIVSDLDTAKEGDTVTLTTKPAEGYLLDTLTVTSDALAPGTVSVKDMGEGIYTFSMPAGNVTVAGTRVPEEATQEWPPFPFDDVSEDDWYYDSVYYVYAYGLMNGTAEATFNPDGATTRGMLVTILYRMEGSPQGGGWSPFTDVDPELYYAQPIAWAAWNGIVKGITETTFSPDAPVTRQQMAAILYRYAAWKKWDVSQQGNLFQFADWEQIQEYARTPLAWASAAGLIQGKENNILDPAGTATRAQVATLLQRFHSAYVVPAEEEAALP